jgi:hypothetical protein
VSCRLCLVSGKTLAISNPAGVGKKDPQKISAKNLKTFSGLFALVRLNT